MDDTLLCEKCVSIIIQSKLNDRKILWTLYKRENSKIKLIMFAVRLIDSSLVLQIKFTVADFVHLMMLTKKKVFSLQRH